MEAEKDWRNAKTNIEFNDKRVAWVKNEMGYAIEDLSDDKQFVILRAINSMLNSYDLLKMEDSFEGNRKDLLEDLMIRLNQKLEEEGKSENFVGYTLVAYWGNVNEVYQPDEVLEVFIKKHLQEKQEKHEIRLNIVYNGQDEVEVKVFDLSEYRIKEIQ